MCTLETTYCCLAPSAHRFDVLHQGLYLGFSGLRSMDTSELYNLWHSSSLNATVYLDASDPTKASLQQVSLFELGGMLASAAKEVQFAALNPGVSASGPLAASRAYKFLHANGPGTMYSPYLKSLDLMVRAEHWRGLNGPLWLHVCPQCPVCAHAVCMCGVQDLYELSASALCQSCRLELPKMCHCAGM